MLINEVSTSSETTIKKLIRFNNMVKDQEEKNQEVYEKDLEEKNKEIANLQEKVRETETRENKAATLATEKLKEQKLFEENLQSELQTQKKLLESKERVAIRNLAEIQTQYNTLLQTTQDKDQILAENHRTITELIALA